MIVRHLSLAHFRNYAALDVDFSPGINVIYGDNAQGKTNLIEAIAYLSACRSHRARGDRELIALDAGEARITADLLSRSRDFRLEIQLRRGQRRRLKKNGVVLKTAAELAGILNTVLFCPEDLYLIRAGAAARRNFLDGAICQMRPGTRRPWRSTNGFMSRKPASCGTGRSSLGSWTCWRTTMSGCARPAPCSSTTGPTLSKS